MEELIARIHAVTRRVSGEKLNLVQSGDLIVNLITREVQRGGAAIRLTAREFNLLEYLMRSPGRVFTRTQILEHVWGFDFDPNTNLIDVHIQRLRKKISPDDKEQLIETIRGIGYRFKKS
jgi:DNA-binding response OmpR family regulator